MQLDFGALEDPAAATAPLVRTELGDGAWIEVGRSWLAGHVQLMDRLSAAGCWRQGQRPMYDRVVTVPRLTAAAPPDPDLEAVGSWLADRYGVAFPNRTMALYRDGSDSVAPHGDMVARELRSSIMATLSLGDRRRFLLRPAAGGRANTLELGRGDLLVMGGTVQRTWRHGIPKTRQAVGPRLCVMFRPVWADGGAPPDGQ